MPGEGGDIDYYYEDDSVTYEKYFRPYCTIASGVTIALLNVLSLQFHLRRCSKSARFGMLTTLLLTYLLCAVLNAVCEVVKVACERTSVLIELKEFDKLQAFLMVSPEMSYVAVSVTSFLMAADRVAVMAIPVKYSQRAISQKLALLATLVNQAIFTLFYTLVFTNANFFAVAKAARNVRYLFCATLLMEVVLYTIFLVQFRNFRKRLSKGAGTESSSQANHIVLFQMVSHFLLCVSPTIVFTANTDLSSSLPSDLNQWIYKAETYNFALYLASYFFSSSFTLFKMLPKRIAVVNVTSGRKNTR
ncbi:hypothetical protein QR680_018432 [Steinernema hermaphroditum]|uniref:Uncharacterized protein n=1 Tax=Steinernema hermaphroditum TaxID=289476 RepID=A0AA39LQU3_9BILA|nr:hypothetical protein QR680_018432 [Steinernema hermaphroditum]